LSLDTLKCPEIVLKFTKNLVLKIHFLLTITLNQNSAELINISYDNMLREGSQNNGPNHLKIFTVVHYRSLSETFRTKTRAVCWTLPRWLTADLNCVKRF